MNFTLTLVLGAFLLATWFDTRLERLRPSSTGWRTIHVAASCVLLQVAAGGAALLVPEGADIRHKLLAVFAILLPVFVYTFVSALWMLRTLAEAAFARR
jgi:hypothetical protein